MTLLLVSFLAGLLTVLAPCILPLLPVIMGAGIVAEGDKRPWYRPLIIVTSLAVSVIIFTLLLKSTTALLGVPQMVWGILSGVIVILFGVTMLAPALWSKLMLATGLQSKSAQLLQDSATHHGPARDILIGASLGPVFTSCSPTYALIVAAILPESFARGLLYLLAYAAGLATILLLLAVAGRAAVRRLGWLSNPSGWFKKLLGAIFILVGVSVIFGWDKLAQTYVLENGWYDPIAKLEQLIPH